MGHTIALKIYLGASPATAQMVRNRVKKTRRPRNLQCCQGDEVPRPILGPSEHLLAFINILPWLIELRVQYALLGIAGDWSGLVEWSHSAGRTGSLTSEHPRKWQHYSPFPRPTVHQQSRNRCYTLHFSHKLQLCMHIMASINNGRGFASKHGIALFPLFTYILTISHLPHSPNGSPEQLIHFNDFLQG